MDHVIAFSCLQASCILVELSRCQVPVPQDRFNFSSAISAGELQADGWRNRTAPRRTLAVLKGLFKVLVGLTLREIERVWNGKALQFHGFIISGSTTGCAEIGEVGVRAFVLHRCPGGFTLKWKTCPVYPPLRCYCCSSSQYVMCNMSCDLKQEFNTLRLSFL